MVGFSLHFSVATRKLKILYTAHMLCYLDSTALESLSMFTWSCIDPPYKCHLLSYLIPSYMYLFLDPILSFQYIPIPLLNFRAWPLKKKKERKKTGSTIDLHFCPHHFTKTALLERTYCPQVASSNCYFSDLLFISHHWSFPSSWNAFFSWLTGHHAILQFSFCANHSIFPISLRYLDTGMFLG